MIISQAIHLRIGLAVAAALVFGILAGETDLKITVRDLTFEGNYDDTLHRIYKQGKRWYANNVNQRRLYYAQEFRPFIQDGSFVMEKRVKPASLWDFLLEKV